jgi:hypothetical protein
MSIILQVVHQLHLVGGTHITGSIIISRSYIRCKMHMYEYNESSTKIAQDIPRHSGELNIN